MLQQGVPGALLCAHTSTSAGNFHPILPFRPEHKGRGGKFAFPPLLNSAIRGESLGREEQQRLLFAGGETMEKKIHKIHVQLLRLPDSGFTQQHYPTISCVSVFLFLFLSLSENKSILESFIEKYYL